MIKKGPSAFRRQLRPESAPVNEDHICSEEKTRYESFSR